MSSTIELENGQRIPIEILDDMRLTLMLRGLLSLLRDSDDFSKRGEYEYHAHNLAIEIRRRGIPVTESDFKLTFH